MGLCRNWGRRIRFPDASRRRSSFHTRESQAGRSSSPSWTRSFPGGIDEGFGKIMCYTLRKPGTYKLRLTLYENLLGGDEPEEKRTRWLQSNELELKVLKKPDEKKESTKGLK